MKKQSLSCVLVVVAGLATAGGLSPAAASAHGSSGRDGGLTEHRLRAFETSVLGSSHATEHARERARQRRPSFRAALRRTARASRRAGLRAAVDATPEVDGQWDAPFSIPAVGIHAALLSSGKVLWYHRPQTTAGKATVAIWDPATGQSKAVAPPQLDGKAANFFCSGQSFLADGRLLVVGGQIASHTETTADSGLNTLYTFNPANETWTRQPDMAEGRWYPTSVLQGDGRTLIMSGQDSSGRLGAPFNNDIEIFTPSPDPDGVGTVALLGKRAQPGTPPGGGLYPHLFAMPSGDTLVAGPWAVDSWTLDGLGDGLRSWTDVPNPSDHRYGTGMILPSGPAGSTRVKLIGGGMAATTVNETFDETNPGAGWVTTPPLQVARKNHNTVGLPDGSMVTVGGGTDDPSSSSFVQDNLAVELSNPDGTWRRGASQAEGRAYHSTALLLPDGRVISAGDDTNGGYTTDTAEIYSPPYLFKGPRPVIASAPATTAWGAGFNVDTPDSDVVKAVLVAPSANTHAVDMNQRVVPLALQSRTGGVRLTAPPNANVAPPGYYMLFLVDNQGVPSVAKWVRLLAPAPPANQVLPTVGGNPVNGGALYVKSRGTWSGNPPPTFLYQWRRCDAAGAACADVSGQNGSVYLLKSADVGRTLRLRVIAYNSSSLVVADSAPSAPIR